MTLMHDPENKPVNTTLLPVEEAKGECAPRSFVPPPLRTGRAQTLLVCLILSGLALCFNLYRVGGPDLWFDEILSVTRAWQPLPALFRIISTTQPNMALYYGMLHFWLSITGHAGIPATEAVVRFPSAVFSAASSPLLYSLARRFFRTHIALFATLLYVLNTLQLTYAQETRSYALQL